MSPDVRGAYFGSLDGAFEGFTFVDDSAATQMMMSASVQARGSGMAMMASHSMHGR